jgi:nicotinamidase-related amidase
VYEFRLETDMTIKATRTPGKSLISPTDHTLVMIDFQSQMAFATKSISTELLRNNAALVANAAAGFNVSTILTTVAADSFSGPMFSEITDAFPNQPLLDRTSMNTWEDSAVIDEVNRIGKERIIFAGLWTSVCIVGPVASAIDQGFDVYFISDACGDISEEAHERAVERMIQLGAKPVSPRVAARLGAHRDLRHDDRLREEVGRRVWPGHHLRQNDVQRFRERPLSSRAPRRPGPPPPAPGRRSLLKYSI